MPHLDAFHTSGFYIAPPLLNSAELEHARQRAALLHARALSGDEPELSSQCVFETDQPVRKRDGRSIDATQNAVFILGDPSHFDPWFLTIFAAPQLIALVARLLDSDDIVIHFANVTSKSPHVGSGISWHRDFPNKYICPETSDMVRTMICLDGMDASCGATRFIAGSQHDTHIQGADIAEDDPRLLTASCAPGAVVAIHPRVLHGGMPNTSSRPRRNIVIQWGTRNNRLVTQARESLTGRTAAELTAMAALIGDNATISS